jgi:hypothetical protein
MPDRSSLYLGYAGQLAVRHEGRWRDFIILGRSDLADRVSEGAGASDESRMQFYFSIRPDRITCGDLDVTAYRNAWTTRQLVGP